MTRVTIFAKINALCQTPLSTILICLSGIMYICFSVEIYAPWCHHCSAFASEYAEIAAHFHESPEKKVSIGKIDGESERALASRFGVKAYPSFYLINGLTVYMYDGTRSYKKIIQFVEGGYKKESSISFFSSPMGPVGILQGMFLATGYGAFDAVEWLQRVFGFSAFFAGMILFGSCFIGIFISIVVIAVILTPKEKRD